MTRGDKSKYTDKQKRKAEHIAAGYEERGVPEDEAHARAWATVNKQDGGGKLGGRLARKDGGVDSTLTEGGHQRPRGGSARR